MNDEIILNFCHSLVPNERKNRPQYQNFNGHANLYNLVTSFLQFDNESKSDLSTNSSLNWLTWHPFVRESRTDLTPFWTWIRPWIEDWHTQFLSWLQIGWFSSSTQLSVNSAANTIVYWNETTYLLRPKIQFSWNTYWSLTPVCFTSFRSNL